MPSIWGNSRFGGTTGSDGHRVIVTYTVSQNILGNYSDVAWQYGVDYGDPNWWNNISNRSISWTQQVGAGLVGVAGFGLSASDATMINTSDPGYGGQIHYFWTGTARITHNGSGAATIRLNAAMSFNSALYTSNITNNDIALPAIPQNPAAPSAFTATRVNDTQASLSWTNNSTGTAPYASIKVYRATDGGGFALIQTLGVVTSYSDTTIVANHKYQYKVSAVGTNTAESSQTAAAAPVYTTPAADTGMTATKLGNGDIRVDWTVNSNYQGNSDLQHDIYDSPDGTNWTYQDTVFGATATWTDVAPSTAVTHRYRTVTFPPGTTLFATSGASNIITLLSTAAAPTGLAPAGVARDAAEAIVFSWTHNPTDGTPQSKRRVQYKIGAGAFVDAVNDSSSVSSYSLPASTLTNGQTITWKVATAGQNGTLGAFSAESVFTTSARPTSTINTPSGGVYSLSLLTASWTYFQAQASAQSSWYGKLFRVDAGPTYVLLEEKTGTTESSTQFSTPLQDGLTYAVRVYVTSAAGLQSVDAATELETFTVDFLPPADVVVSAVYQPGEGTMIVTAVGGPSISNVQALVLDGTGDWGTTTDKAALDITGDLDLAADIQPDGSWTPATHTGIIEKWLTASNLSYALTLDTAGKIRMRITTSGLIATLVEAISSVAVGAASASRLAIRAARVGTTVTFYTSTDTDLLTANWVQLGTTQTLSGTIFSGTSAVTIGSNGAGAAFAGKVYSAMIKNSAGTTVANPVYIAEAPGTTSFSDAFSNTWTLVGNANIALAIPGKEAIDHIDLQRRINGGEWVTWAAGIELPIGDYTVNVADTACITKGDNTYRAVVWSALPSSAFSNEDTEAVADPAWGYLGGGPGFSEICKMRARLNSRATVGRSKATYHFAGRPKPVELSGEEESQQVAVAATLYPPSMGGQSSEPEELEALGLTTGPVLWRDYMGRRIFASLSPVSVDYNADGNKYPVAFNLTQVDYDENVG